MIEGSYFQGNVCRLCPFAYCKR